MEKLNIKNLIVGLLFLLPMIAICQSDYVPLTDNQVLNWWNSLTKEEKIETIKKLDYIESVPLIIPDPEYQISISGNDLILMPTNNPVLIKHGHLIWEINFEEKVYKNFNSVNFLDHIISDGIFLIGGVFITYINGEQELWKYILNSCLSVALSELTLFILN